MIRDKTSDVTTLSNLGADRLRMELDEDGLVHICDMLIGQYSDEEMAVLREYSTNARDSHIAAGTPDRPIEVTLPVDPYSMPSADKGRFLRIKDYGVGLSLEEIGSVFSRIGKSTKDESNEQNGMMGIGGKSGLCATFGTFKITAVKDGEKAVVMCGRNEATEPIMDLVSVSETDESNGVEIELPSPKYHTLRRKAEALFQFWPENSVLVDRRAPKRLQPKIEISPTMWVCEGLYSKNQRTDFIVMADVPYPIQLDAKLADNHSLVIFVPTGAVTIAPSREALRMTPKTKDEIARLMADYDQKVRSTIQTNVDAAKNKAEAVKVALKWRSAFATEADLQLTYKGQKMPMYFEVGSMLTNKGAKDGIVVTKHNDSKGKSKHSRQSKIFIGTLTDAVLVHGFAGATFATIHKQKLEHWAASNNLAPAHYVLTEKKLAHGWIDSTMRVDWETIKAIKLSAGHKGSKGGPRPTGSYDVMIGGEWQIGTPADQIDLSEAIFYMGRKYFDGYRYHARKSRKIWFVDRYPKATFVELTENRVNKFKRDFPQARHADEITLEIYDEFKQTVKQSDLIRLKADEDHNRGLLTKLDIARVDDPAVKKAIRLFRKPVNEKLRAELHEIQRLVGRWNIEEDKALAVTWKNPIDAYPLASLHRLEHTYIYMNAVYAAQENKT